MKKNARFCITVKKVPPKPMGTFASGRWLASAWPLFGCRLIGLDESMRHDQIKKLIEYIEEK
ncbi:MAG: hypothetical protein JSW26_10335 [Desulfobacterales bacterium]|nr:MAG: hypothetical protein JSW26_10335 [Desulfobacterales bacterium]